MSAVEVYFGIVAALDVAVLADLALGRVVLVLGRVVLDLARVVLYLVRVVLVLGLVPPVNRHSKS